ncbi:MAG: AAA family ATPase, partial [Desulfobacterales bacterium]|nr:AAA family ATPase [Desulfobacterales bacterium]
MDDFKNRITASTDRDSHVELEGQIERITYFHEETGYTVAKIRASGYLESVTVVGHLIAPRPGEILKMRGAWLNHPKFGRQFKVMGHRTMVPASAEGIRKYLGSGLIKGIGPVMASRIVKEFGDRTLEVIEKGIDELQKIEGIGPKRVEMIERAWKEQKEIREVMIFLQEHGVSPGYATKIFKNYGWDSISVVSQNPYRLATEIFGIGFLTADRIAQRLGFDKSAPVRAEAGILYGLGQLSEEGHVYYPYEPLVERCKEMLEVDRDTVVQAMARIAYAERIVIEDLNEDPGAFEPNHKAVYLKPFHVSETGIAKHLAGLLSAQKEIRKINVEKAIQWVHGKINLELAPKQIEAVKGAISEKNLIITGGPGTGKTTIINAVIKIYGELGARVLLAAPTGRASKRMSEATGYPARTIHRMLEFNPQKGGFLRDQDRP